MADYAPQVRKLLRHGGWQYDRPGKGDHEIWRNPNDGRKVVVDAKILSRHTECISAGGYPSCRNRSSALRGAFMPNEPTRVPACCSHYSGDHRQCTCRLLPGRCFGLPHRKDGSASLRYFRSLLGIHCTLRPAGLLDPRGPLSAELEHAGSLRMLPG